MLFAQEQLVTALQPGMFGEEESKRKRILLKYFVDISLKEIFLLCSRAGVGDLGVVNLLRF